MVKTRVGWDNDDQGEKPNRGPHVRKGPGLTAEHPSPEIERPVKDRSGKDQHTGAVGRRQTSVLERLKELEAEGILERTVIAETPVRIEYH